MTSQLLELWGVDDGALVDTARKAVGSCDVYLGGSLADDVGTITSDIDLYCFVDRQSTAARVPSIVTRTRGTVIECHIVFAHDYLQYGESFKDILTGPDDPARMPYPSPADLRCMHALYRDRALASGSSAESVRRNTASDLTHIYVALRSAISCESSAEDALAMLDVGEYWNALYSARLVAEFALDTALAVAGEFNPNPKWRMSLAERARFNGTLPYDIEGLVPGLFPNPLGRADAFGAVLALAQGCLLAASDSLLRTFTQLDRTSARVALLAERVGVVAPTFEGS